MSLVESVLNGSYLAPTRWTTMPPSTDVELIDLAYFDLEFLKVESKLSPHGITPTRIERVQNPYLWGCYLLTRECARRSGAVELEMWHATPEWNVPSIVRDNLDWRRAARVRFGKGVSFSPDPKYACKYSSCSGGTRKVLILAKVLVGHMCLGHSGVDIPPGKCDTSTDNSNKVFVKYVDNEFYPVYVVHHNILNSVG